MSEGSPLTTVRGPGAERTRADWWGFIPYRIVCSGITVIRGTQAVDAPRNLRFLMVLHPTPVTLQNFNPEMGLLLNDCSWSVGSFRCCKMAVDWAEEAGVHAPGVLGYSGRQLQHRHIR